jgi:putative addiction module killer protein
MTEVYYGLIVKRCSRRRKISCLPVYPMGYNRVMIEVRQTEMFRTWLAALRDRRAQARIAARIQRAAYGNLGDVRPVGNGVSEMRVDYGPGYRVYFIQRQLIVLLCGGDKSTQSRDIERAQALAEEV